MTTTGTGAHVLTHTHSPSRSRRAGHGALAVLLAALLVLFGDPRPANAFAGPPVPVSLAPIAVGAATTAAGAAGCLAVCTGALIVGGAVGVAALGCWALGSRCRLPWQHPKSEGAPAPNSDQPIPPGPKPCRWTDGGPVPLGTCVAQIQEGENLSPQWKFSAFGTNSYDALIYAYGVNDSEMTMTTRDKNGVVTDTRKERVAGFKTQASFFQTDFVYSREHYVRVEIEDLITRLVQVVLYYGPDYVGVAPELPKRHNPDRFVRGHRECKAKGATASDPGVRVYGPMVTFTEAGDHPEITLPACPASEPVPWGVGAGAPKPNIDVVPDGHVEPLSDPAPKPIIPPMVAPQANPKGNPYPECPTPEACPMRAPSTPGDRGKPLPRVNPDGSPALAPDGSPLYHPLPEPAPGEEACLWGPYGVPEANCAAAAPVSDPAPTTAPTTGPTTGPAPGGDPYPRPEPQNDPDGCLSTAVTLNPLTWVLAPIKCAFIPTRDTTEQLVSLRQEFSRKPPGSAVMWAVDTVPSGFQGFQAGSDCTAMPDFDPAQLGRLRLPCAPDNAAFRFGMGLASAFFYGLTGLRLWSMGLAAMKARAGGGGMEAA